MGSISKAARNGHAAHVGNGNGSPKTRRQPGSDASRKPRRGDYDFVEDGVEDDAPVSINAIGTPPNDDESDERDWDELTQEEQDALEEQMLAGLPDLHHAATNGSPVFHLAAHGRPDPAKAAASYAAEEEPLLKRDAAAIRADWQAKLRNGARIEDLDAEELKSFLADPRAVRTRLRRAAAKAGKPHPNDEPQSVAVPVQIVEFTGGGLAALIASQALYWLSQPQKGHSEQPRARMQPWKKAGVNNHALVTWPMWRTTYEQLSREVGAPTDRKGHKQVTRALRQLQTLGLIRYRTGHRVPSDSIGYLDAPLVAFLASADRRRHVGIEITTDLKMAVNDGRTTVNLVRAAAVEKYGPNEAILLTQVMWRKRGFVKKKKTEPVKARYSDLAATTGLSTHQVRRAAKSLVAAGGLVLTKKVRERLHTSGKIHVARLSWDVPQDVLDEFSSRRRVRIRRKRKHREIYTCD